MGFISTIDYVIAATYKREKFSFEAYATSLRGEEWGMRAAPLVVLGPLTRLGLPRCTKPRRRRTIILAG